MKSRNKRYFVKIILSIAGFVLIPCNVFGQVKYYNSMANIKDYNYTSTLSFYNFNKKPITTNSYKISILDYKLSIEQGNYSQFCDSSGEPILTRQHFSYFDKLGNKIPLFFSPKENELHNSGFFTNKTKYVFSLLTQYFRPPDEFSFPGYINIIRFNKDYELIDTIMIKDDMYNWNQLYIEYSPNCDFNYLLTTKLLNRKFTEIRVYKTDSIFNRIPSKLYIGKDADMINTISPKGDILVMIDRAESRKLNKQYSKFYHFNSQKLSIDQTSPILGLQTENNSLAFSADGQSLFLLSNDSVIQFSLKYLQKDSILKTRKLLGMIEKSSIGVNQFTPYILLPDENIFFGNNTGVGYQLLKQNENKYILSKTNIRPSNVGDVFTGKAYTALYHPHFRIESKDTICINEAITLKTNHIDSFATYHWIIKDAKNTVLLNSYSISPTFKPAQPGLYDIQLIYRWRCNSMDSTSKILYVKDYPKIEKIKDSLICYNEIYKIKIDSIFKKVIWNNSTTGNKFVANKQGVYSVSYTDGCQFYKDTFEVKVIDELKPQVSNPQVVLCSQSETFSTGFTLPNYSKYRWSDGYLLLNRSKIVPGNYKIQFYNKCQSIDESLDVLYSEKKTELFIPNAVTPNGDQLNENWEINDPSNIKEIEWIIFNRWGEKIDTGINTSFALKKLINANNSNQGIYYYQFIITFQCNSTRKTYNGIFHILD